MGYERPVNKNQLIERYKRRALIMELREEDSVQAIYSAKIAGPPVYVPLFHYKVPAGFPDATGDHRRKLIDLNEYLSVQPNATFHINVGGDSMIDEGILPGDIAVVDKSVTAKYGDSIVAIIYGEFTIKTFCKGPGEFPILRPANARANYKPIYVTEEMGFEIWGVVVGTVRKFRNK